MRVSVFPALAVDLSLGGRLGITGLFGPSVDGYVRSEREPPLSCAGIEAVLKGQAEVFAEVLVKRWSFTIGEVSVARQTILGEQCEPLASPSPSDHRVLP